METRKAKREKKKEKRKKIILFTILIIFVAIMIFSGIKIIEWIKENKQNQNVISDISSAVDFDENIDNINKYNIDFNTLKQTNSDTVAWFKVNGTKIEYPIVKTIDNEFYLTHSFDKSYNSCGWIFMECNNKLDGTDKNTVIYGHNRRDSSMFGTLKNILTENWQKNENNFIIPFITEVEKAEYQVFSVYRIENEDYYITTNFGTDNEFQKFIDKIKSRSEKDFGVQVNIDDQILTLSTCADNNKYRVVLHAKKIISERPN